MRRGHPSPQQIALGVAVTILFLLLIGCAPTASVVPPTQSPKTNPITVRQIALQVLTPDGNPAAGALAVLVPPNHYVNVTDGLHVDDEPGCPRFTIPSDGRLRFPIDDGPLLLIVLHSQGYAQLDLAQLLATSDIHLQSWGHIRGQLKIGAIFPANQEMYTWSYDLGIGDPNGPRVSYCTKTTTDANGRFAFDRVPNDTVFVSRLITWKTTNAQSAVGSRQTQMLQIAPGQTAAVCVGGTGRPVIGKLNLPPELARDGNYEFFIASAAQDIPLPSPPMPDAIKQASPDRQGQWYEQFMNSDTDKAFKAVTAERSYSRPSYAIDMNPDGTFRINDVVPGTYVIDIDICRKFATGSARKGEIIARGEGHFLMPPTVDQRGDQALAIADVPVAFTHNVHIADIAPDFHVQTLDGKPIDLSDFRGQWVLLDFWATWCGGCIAQTPYLDDIYSRYGQSGRLAMISLDMDDSPLAGKKYADEHALKWTQAYAGVGWEPGIATDYGVQGIPSIWLIAPDGTVFSKHLLSEKIMPAVAAVLDKSPGPIPSTRPSQF